MLESFLARNGFRWPMTALVTGVVLGLLGPVVIDLEQGLPLSLQSLLVCWLPLMLGWRAGVAGVLIYLAAGAFGLPVFAGHRAGLDIIAGPTGGYLLGMPVAALVLGTIASETSEDTSDRNRYVRIAIGMILGHLIILAMGIPWQRQVQPDLDLMALAEKLYRPLLLKSALGVLLSVLVMRVAAPRA